MSDISHYSRNSLFSLEQEQTWNIFELPSKLELSFQITRLVFVIISNVFRVLVCIVVTANLVINGLGYYRN